MASASAAAVGGGLAQIPGSDSVPLATIQLTMTISLGKVFGKSLTESSAKAAMGSALASQVGRTISQIAIGWWPGIGNVIMVLTAAAVTEALDGHWLKSLMRDFYKDKSIVKNGKGE